MLILHFFLAAAGMELFWFYTAAWGPPLELSTAVREILPWPEKGPTGDWVNQILLLVESACSLTLFIMKNLLRHYLLFMGI